MKTRTLPLLALRQQMVYPTTSVFFEVSRKQSLKALEEAINNNDDIFLVNQIDPSVEKPGREDLYDVGIIARIVQMVKAGQNVLRVFVEGKLRARILDSRTAGEGMMYATILPFEPDHFPENPEEETALIRLLEDHLESYSRKNPGVFSVQLQKAVDERKLYPLINEIANELPFEIEKKQQILEESDVRKQAEMLLITLEEETSIVEIRNNIAARVKKNVDKNQRDYVLREQQKVIREELGEADFESEADEYEAKVEELKAGKEVKEKIRKEIRKFRTVPPMAAESTVMKNYIETMLEMPWNKATRDHKDLNRAIRILDEDHYGLEKVKERVIDYLAVRTLTKNADTPILCLAGPPGTGKTSIARSIARALGRKYVRISLGGVRDEAEIRGHRKTYVGSMPGRIAEGIRQAGVKNPLMLLDEIDKTSSDYKGDTASALLEVLDGEQNCNFRDHYLEVPLDLSEVLFIATANDLSTIARPLLDRMEIIELSSYTENEKYHIAQDYLIEKQRKASGIHEDQIHMEDDVILTVIRSYTREAGVRELERKIGLIMHKVARKIVEGATKVEVKVEDLEEMLGIPPYDEDDKAASAEVGIVRGLAWTAVGGDTLSIEVNIMPGSGKVVLTGRMGDVMKESAQIGRSYIRSIADRFEIDEEFFEKHDIHLHIPEGAVPKDGPSAGITMALAMLSAITGKPVRGDIAMTGEITLRGRVLPVGGLKEKLLAAKNAGMKEVIVPARNKKNVLELSDEITGGMEFTYADSMDTVMERAFAG